MCGFKSNYSLPIVGPPNLSTRSKMKWIMHLNTLLPGTRFFSKNQEIYTSHFRGNYMYVVQMARLKRTTLLTVTILLKQLAQSVPVLSIEGKKHPQILNRQILG
jgi:hypothetical protein